jgi:glycosyltransferase involved in cell wall biosynthesis
MTKLVIQIPCFNEAATLPVTLADLPSAIDGIDLIETLIVDDGSTDETYEIAGKLNVDRIVRLPRNRGLANAFSVGLSHSLELEADIIVNTDADNQYQGDYIQSLIKPILRGEADIVIGNRQIDTIAHFSWSKKLLQKLGSWVVRWVSKTDIPDATSGFRAFRILRLYLYP